MKYGSYGNPKITIAQAPIKRGKKPSEKKKDLLKLKKSFPDIDQKDIERVYNENNENIEDSILNLSAFCPEKDLPEEKLDFLQNMFGDNKEFIKDVLNECNGDVSKTAAFLIEKEEVEENDQDIDSSFGSENIGFVNKQALQKRCNQNFEEMIIEMFPNLDSEEVIRTYNECNKNVILTMQLLGDSNQPIVEEIKPVPVVKKYDEEYPDILKAPKSRLVTEGYWSKDKNNHFLEGNNVDAVKKIKVLKNAFPAVDDEIVKSIFFQMGDDLNETINMLREMFPNNYREVKAELPIYIPHPTEQEVHEIPEQEFEMYNGKKIPDSQFDSYLANMQKSKRAHDYIFQMAANSAAAGNFVEAKNLSEEGKKYQKMFREIYLKIYREIFRRNNPDAENSDKIDLHGLQVEEAILMVGNYLKLARGKFKKVEVVTGKGSHSIRGISKLKPAVSSYFSEKGIKYSELEGGFIVTFS